MLNRPTDPAAVPRERAADELAIMRLVNRFEIAFDYGDFDAHLATWADEMSFSSPFGAFTGKHDYARWLRGFYDWAQTNFGGTRHLITNFDIAFDGDEAARAFSDLTVLARKGPAIAATSACVDTVRLIDGQWLIVHRDLEVDQEFDLDG